jgi:septum formation protein
MTIVLASASRIRRALLERAGVGLRVDPASIDEATVKESLAAGSAKPAEMAETLAELKAQRISPKYPGLIVLGADQILECAGKLFDKPADLGEARGQLQALRGRKHRLLSSVVALRDGTRLWHHTGEAVLTMRDFSDTFLDDYLAEVGPKACESVGAYQLEARGAQLFGAVEGDYFTVLGLPLLPLLDFLRAQGELTA